MTARHLVVLVEEPSMEAFLQALLPRILPTRDTFEIRAFQGKLDFFKKLEARLRGYATWLPDNWRILVLVDRDDDDCRALKARLEQIASAAGLSTRATARSATWQVATRIAIEELEAWYFGEWEAVRSCFPRVSSKVPLKEGYRNPDAILGGSWEAFERELQRHRYFETGLRKIEAARLVGAAFDPAKTSSASFRCFLDAVIVDEQPANLD